MTPTDTWQNVVCVRLLLSSEDDADDGNRDNDNDDDDDNKIWSMMVRK